MNRILQVALSAASIRSEIFKHLLWSFEDWQSCSDTLGCAWHYMAEDWFALAALQEDHQPDYSI